jgi:linoleoyl-CoA desaturase
MYSHNVVHHTWTNVLQKDLDVGYGILRITPMQKWHPVQLLQPLFATLLMLLFEEGVALHEQAIADRLRGQRTLARCAPCSRTSRARCGARC